MPNLPDNWGYRFLCQRVLPAVYDDSFDYYEVLCKLMRKVNDLGENDEALAQLLLELNEEFEQFKASGFDDYYKAQVIAWVDSHLELIFRLVIKQVYFGITTDGFFVAYIPDSWNDIQFDTGHNITNDNYGRLILRYEVNSIHNVDQTPEVV